MHLENTSRQFQNCDNVIHYINQKGYIDYAKTNFYNQLTLDQKQKAIVNADWLHGQNEIDLQRGESVYRLNPYTDFDKLMKYLHNL